MLAVISTPGIIQYTSDIATTIINNDDRTCASLLDFAKIEKANKMAAKKNTKATSNAVIPSKETAPTSLILNPESPPEPTTDYHDNDPSDSR